jgi:transcriptional regulator with XRE-family HTH domain
MNNKSVLEKYFGEIKESKFIELATQWEAEKIWKEKSQHIALELLDFLDENNLTQKAFAAMMGISPQAVNKWLKGQENFTLETIAKLEAVMKRNLIEIVTNTATTEIVMEESATITEKYTRPANYQNSNFTTAKIIKMHSDYYVKTKGC